MASQPVTDPVRFWQKTKRYAVGDFAAAARTFTAARHHVSARARRSCDVARKSAERGKQEKGVDYRCLTGHILSRQPTQHRLSLTITAGHRSQFNVR